MKLHSLFALVLGVLFSLPSFAQAQDVIKEPVVFKNSDVAFHQIDEHTWHGNGFLMYNESMYLIEGEERAILLDAGTKIPGLKKIVEGITKKPVTLVATHVHPDHTGSAVNDWDTIWINAADEVNVPTCMPGYEGTKMYMHDGMVFDLGGRKIEVVFTPGHTPGSVTFVDVEKHYGFSGDAFGSGNLLVFTDLSTVAATCQRFARFIQKYDIKYFYPGHYWGNNLETPERVKNVGLICEGILNGMLEPIAGNNRSLPHIVDMFGVKINYGEAQKR